MTTETPTQASAEATNQAEARKIWEQLEAEDRGDATPPVTTEPAATTEATAQAAANEGDGKPVPEGTEAAVDPKELVKQIISLQSTVNQLTGRMRNAEGHIGGLNSTVKQQVEAARTVRESGAAAPTATEISAAQASPEAFAALEKEYPEFAKAMKPALDAAIAAQMAEFKKTLPQPAAQVEKPLTQADLDTFKAEQKIEEKHKGWDVTVTSDPFKSWLGSAPYEVQMLAHSKAPEHAIRLLDLFEESKKPAPKPEPTPTPQRLASAAALPTGNKSAVRTKNVDEMTPQEYWAYLDQQDKLKA